MPLARPAIVGVTVNAWRDVSHRDVNDSGSDPAHGYAPRFRLCRQRSWQRPVTRVQPCEPWRSLWCIGCCVQRFHLSCGKCIGSDRLAQSDASCL
jgi:hypothetical protein